MTLAIVPGSFDPMTLGHKDVIERATRLFDRVVVAIMINPDKQGMFTLLERKRIAELTLSGLDVEILVSEGYLVELAERLGADAIVKGVRTIEDFEYEQSMALFNHEHYPDCETIYLPSYGKKTSISSTAARARIMSGEATADLLADAADEYIRNLRQYRTIRG